MIEEYLQRIQSEFFEHVDSYQVIQSGWTNIVVEVNAKWIFRFVRDTRNTQIVVERDFLPQFEKNTSVEIPSLMMSGEDFIAYRKIVGERFSPEKFAAFSSIQKNEIIKNLGDFLTCLHKFQFLHPHLSAVPYGGGDFWIDLWPPVKNRLSNKTRTKAENFFTTALDRINAFPFEKTVTHSDLGTNNILVDFERRRLGGIIDFGDLSLSDPAVDFAGFYRHFGRQFVQEMLRYYERSVEGNFWERIEYEALRKPFFVVYFALNYGFEQHVPGIIAYIEELF